MTRGRSWVNEIVSRTAFDDYEGQALDNLNRYGVESGFCVQYFRGGRTEFYEFAKGDNGSVTMAVPHGGDRLLHVHYHPDKYVSPSTKDVHESDKDAGILRKELEVPPVLMIGARVDESPLYLAMQREKFPGVVERFLLPRFKPDNWRRLSTKLYEMESNRMLYEAIRDRLGEERELELRNKPYEEVLAESGITYSDIALMTSKAVERGYGFKTAVLASTDKFPDAEPISDKRAWILGNGELFG